MTIEQSSGRKLDFSEAAARRAALSEAIQHPMTLIPSASSFVVAFGLTLLCGVSAPAAAVIAGVGVVFSAANYAFQLKKGGYVQKYFENLRAEFERIREEKSAQLTLDLKRLKCRKGMEQVGQLEEKFNNLDEVFRRVLSENELTFSRFIGTVEQLYRSGLENLESVVVLLMNIDDIDKDDISERLDVLKKISTRTAAQEKTLTALQNQLNVFDETTREVEDLLASNEEALATMDKTGQVALQVKNRSSTQTPQEVMADAMQLLTQMIDRAKTSRTPAVMLEQTAK